MTWKQLNNIWAPTPVAVPFSYQPRYVQYTDPTSGTQKKVIAVPAARYEGNEDARGGFGALQYESVMSQYEAYNTDARKPMLVVLHHDGDNYGGGSDQYYHSNFQSFVSWLQANPSRFVCTTIQDYLDMFPPDSSDVIHVENGSWAGADNGDLNFEMERDESGDRLFVRPQLVGCGHCGEEPCGPCGRYSGTDERCGYMERYGNDSAKALHYFYSGEASDHWYWDGTEIWDSILHAHATRLRRLLIM